jgi:HK97 family phage prohead protease
VTLPSPDVSLRSDNLEYRSALELRAVGDRIVGHAIVFDARSRDLGGFVEVVKPSAVDRSLTADIVALYNHDPGAVLGRTPRTLQLRKDDRGLAFTLDPAPTQAGRETLELVRRGDLTGASFGFRLLKESWSMEGGTPIRSLLDLELVEISLCALPVYPQTNVEIAQRSLQAWQQQGHRIDWLRMRERVTRVTLG